MAKQMKEWYCWHDDGRATMVRAIDDRVALMLACDLWEETDISVIAVEEKENANARN